MELLEKFFGLIGDLTWGWALIPFLVVLGLFFTVSTGFVQVRYFLRMFRVLSGKNQSGDPNAISAREALLVSVGGRVGGGNIAGVAVAITVGGPGGGGWRWAVAAVGVAAGLFECWLGQVCGGTGREGSFRGGPAGGVVYGGGGGGGVVWIGFSSPAFCSIAPAGPPGAAGRGPVTEAGGRSSRPFVAFLVPYLIVRAGGAEPAGPAA
jgi:Na+/alanine symporter